MTRYYALGVVALVVLLGGAYVIYQQPAYLEQVAERFRTVFSGEASGFFVLETAGGSLAVVTDGGEQNELLADASAKPFSAHGVIAPDGSRGAAVRFSPNVLEVVSFSLGSSPDVQVLATHDVAGAGLGGHVLHPVWSADSRTFAYQFSPAIPETALAQLVGPQGGFDPLSGLSVAAGTEFPQAYVSTIHVVFNNQPAEQRGTGTPIAFSPDGRTLLAEDGSELSVISLETGERVQVVGGPVFESSGSVPPQFRFVSGSSHLLVWTPTERIEVYGFDWERGALTRLGELPAGESAREVLLDSSTGARVLVVTFEEGKRRVVEYRLGERIERVRSYDLKVAPDARLLQWFSE